MGKEGIVSTTVTAEAGDYDRGKNTLKLNGKIAVDSAEGYAIRMTDADIDFEAGTMASPNPVHVTYGEHKTTGKSLAVTESGDIIILKGEVRTTLMPEKRVPAQVAPPQEQVRR
jgi:hypothetical protein